MLIFGLAGALRRDELYKMKTDNIEDLGTIKSQENLPSRNIFNYI